MACRSLALVSCLAFGSLSAGCGEKGSGTGDETGGAAGTSGGSAGSGGATGGNGGSGGTPAEEMVLFGFDTNVEGFQYEIYEPGPDANGTTYTNVGADSTIDWDDGEGADGQPGRLRLEMPFSAPNELADIQVNYPATDLQDWSGKTLRASVMVESGLSTDESNPSGAYIFVKTTSGYIWGRGLDGNLLPSALGTWVKLAFVLDDPSQSNDGFDASQVISLGIQFFTGGQATGVTESVVYVDQFTIQ